MSRSPSAADGQMPPRRAAAGPPFLSSSFHVFPYSKNRAGDLEKRTMSLSPRPPVAERGTSTDERLFFFFNKKAITLSWLFVNPALSPWELW
jgi:hypothetical protein